MTCTGAPVRYSTSQPTCASAPVRPPLKGGGATSAAQGHQAGSKRASLRQSAPVLPSPLAHGGKPSFSATVLLHAWMHEDGAQNYADPVCDRVDGWCVYTRVETPADAVQGFDISAERDFDTFEEAQAEAAARCISLGQSPDEYREY